MNTEKKTTTKRKATVAIATLLVCVLAIGGTIAWLTSHSKLNNQFTVGDINPIKPDDHNPDKPDPSLKDKLDGNLWVIKNQMSVLKILEIFQYMFDVKLRFTKN